MLVEDDEIEEQPLDPQVLVRLEQFGDERDAAGVGDADEQDREIPRDAVLPQLALAPPVPLDRLDVAQPRISRDQPAAEPLELQGVFDRQPEVPELDLAVRAGERQRACHGAAVVVLRDQAERVLLAFGVARS